MLCLVWNTILTFYFDTGFCGPNHIYLGSSVVTDLSSPAFPAFYPHDLDCHWIVVASRDRHTIVARVVFFHLEKGFDYLTIGNGDIEHKASTIASLTGNLKVSALVSSMSNMWMALTTDSTGHFQGYQFELEQIPATERYGNYNIITIMIRIVFWMWNVHAGRQGLPPDAI